MNMPKLTKKDKRSHAEKVIDEKIDKYADDAQKPEEICKVQQMIQNQQTIRNGKKNTIFGLAPETVFTGAVSLVQIGAIIKAEDLRAITSKAMAFVHKGRLR